jgi:hypothetical protein
LCSSINGWSSMFSCPAILLKCLILFSIMTSFTSGTFKSTCSVVLVTYHGALVIMRNILDWLLWIIDVFVLLAQPHISTPYSQIGFIILYSKSLLSNESLELLQISQCISLIFRSICFLFFVICSFQDRWLSRWIPTYFVLGESGVCMLLNVTGGHCSLRSIQVSNKMFLESNNLVVPFYLLLIVK